MHDSDATRPDDTAPRQSPSGPPPDVQARVRITGIVQGVCFRHETRVEARRLGVLGWVRNRRDGAVEGVFEGPRDRVDALIRWCGRGPPAARVDDVRVEWGDATGEFADFRVTH